ncbi:MarR family winged helix-turn-helix transcriptional regulator [Actinoplanes derwentensis]|uniref:DNA-binding transcriptional regulator, MarR family n=1 Tax=Actinoplanes derwentensis TaxID=113562 RepID=A0A1H1ZYJ1_9ACTN|nr:MarR family transcriptional regulator [Actinoplanes derwentensis]GID83473.1 MarR family transcriptional regulator [Actinoplanes derwentensis]SDT38774.1 DNA-binding transcriptional regulator, MarR family [Actinoplanes derwentensis]
MDHLPSWLLNQVSAHAQRLIAEGFAATGARGYHFRLLDSLVTDGPASQAALGRRTGIHLSDLVGALNELESAGFVRRAPDPADKRRNVVSVTGTGRERAAELSERVAAIQEELLAPLSRPERDQLTGLLRRLLEHHGTPATDRSRPAAASRPEGDAWLAG